MYSVFIYICISVGRRHKYCYNFNCFYFILFVDISALIYAHLCGLPSKKHMCVYLIGFLHTSHYFTISLTMN